jgi:hypothetical protein
MSDQENTPLLPPPRHEFDMVPDDVRTLFQDILKHRVDPSGEYYGMTLEHLRLRLANVSPLNCVAIDSDVRYEEKGHMYDPILQSFIQGCGGQISTWAQQEHQTTPVVLRGVTKRKQMEACRAAGRDFYYIDTGYFGNGKKKTYHRITKNDVQNFGPIIDRPNDRWDRLGLKLRKFRRDGDRILLAPPSQKLLNLYNINLEEWLQNTIDTIRAKTDREVVVRLKKGRAERQSTDTMEMALADNIFCLVTFSSIAAGEALLCGKPAITLGPNAAAPLCSQTLDEIDNPRVPTLDEMAAWCRHISYCQFTEAEMRDGTAWRILNGG